MSAEEAPSLLRGFRALLGAEVVVRSLVVLSTVVLSRLLGPSRLGDLAIAFALLSYASAVGDAGLTVWTQREVVRDRDANVVGRVVSATLMVQTVVCLVLTAALIGALPYFPVPHGSERLVIAGVPVLLAQALSLLYLVQAQERMALLARLRVVSQFIATLGGVVAVVLTNDVVWMPVMSWIGVLVTDAGALPSLYRGGLRLRVPRWLELSTAVKGGLPYLANGLVVTVLMNLDVIVVGAIRGSREAGIYGSAYRLAFAGLTLAGVVVASVFPRMISFWYSDKPRFERLVHSLVVLSARVTMPATAVVLVSGPEIIRLLFGNQFQGGGGVLRAVFLWVPLGWLNTMTGQALVAAGRQGAHLLVASISAALTVGLLIALVSIDGARGAGIAVVLTEVATCIGFSIATRRLLGMELTAPFFRQGLYLVLPLAVLLPLHVLNSKLALPVGVPLAALSLLAFEHLTGRSTLRLLMGTRRVPPSEEVTA